MRARNPPGPWHTNKGMTMEQPESLSVVNFQVIGGFDFSGIVYVRPGDEEIMAVHLRALLAELEKREKPH